MAADARPPALPPVVRALLDAAVALVRRSSSGSVALASLAGVVDLDAIPRAYRARVQRELEAAVAATSEPLPLHRVERELRAAWGSPPDAVLDGLEAEPLTVTPSAQVHRGELDGAAVAITVRRPGLAASVRSDLGLLDALGPPLGRVFAALDAGALLREARERALDDLDLEHAAATQRRLGRAARRLEGVRVPAVRTELAAPGVLVADLLEGPTLAAAQPPSAGAAARALVAFHLGAPRAVGLAPADPRPDHVVLLGDGGIGLLGTGAASPVDRDRFGAFLDALEALREEDRAAFVAAVQRMGLLPADAAAAA
ncbi:MAG TPA: AarF/UbiB family protein, partial [Solirubrobacteraceae bacterium]|nr:AarF/UbiB family protein [Solirubrobacteraceae bacterium]